MDHLDSIPPRVYRRSHLVFHGHPAHRRSMLLTERIDDLRRPVGYIHFNPVKHGHVKRVRDWPYSSFHRYVRHGLLPSGWGDKVDADGDFGERL